MKLLELGCGNQPALDMGGALFEDSVDYTGVDISLPVRLQGSSTASFIEADISSMPFFDDATFDYLLMRNFFGQFCDGTINPLEADRTINGGLRVAYRILRPLGHIAVVEENTPMDADDVQYFLEKFGFCVIEREAMSYGLDNLYTNNPWYRLRSRFYADTPIQTAPDEFLGTPHVMLATK